MGTYRCSTCNINWPLAPGYRLCINCGEGTSAMSREDSLEKADAESLANHIRFERYYVARELKQLEANVSFPPDAAPGGQSVG